MHEFLTACQARLLLEFSFDEIFNGFDIVVGGTLDGFYGGGIIGAERAGDSTQRNYISGRECG